MTKTATPDDTGATAQAIWAAFDHATANGDTTTAQELLRILETMTLQQLAA